MWHLKQAQSCASTPLKAGTSKVQEFRIRRRSASQRISPGDLGPVPFLPLLSLRRAQCLAIGLKVEMKDEGRPQSEVALKVSSVGGV